MKKNFLSVLLAFGILVCLSIVFDACSKSGIYESHVESENNIQHVSESILKDSSFTNLVNDFISEYSKISSINIDSNLIRQSNERLAKSLIQFIIIQKEYNNLNAIEKKKVLQFMSDSLKSNTYLVSNPGIQSNMSNLKTISITNEFGVNSTYGKIKSFKINEDDIINCCINTAINALSFYGDELSDVYTLMRGGTPLNLLIDMGIDILKNASPWWKVGLITIEFSRCLYLKM